MNEFLVLPEWQEHVIEMCSSSDQNSDDPVATVKPKLSVKQTGTVISFMKVDQLISL